MQMNLILLFLSLVTIALQQQPCPPGQKYIPSGHQITPNGCGANSQQVLLGKLVLSDDKLLTPCCNQHDICFAQCDPDNTLRHKFNDCNSQFNSCNRAKCQTINNLFSRTRCSFSANAMQTAVQKLGWSYFLEDQTNTCKCTAL